MKRPLWTICRASGALLAALVAACAPTGGVSLDAAAEGYVRAALQAAQHQPDLVEAFHGPPAWRPGPRVPVNDVRIAVERLQHDLARLDAGGEESRTRAVYLRHQLAALHLAVDRLLGHSRPFRDEVSLAYGIEWPRPNEVTLTKARSQLERLLPGDGRLIERYRRWRIGRAVPPEARGTTFDSALARCREATARVVHLPEAERTTVRWREGLGWDAAAVFDGHLNTTIDIVSGTPRSAYQLARLACHEAYPGHHAQHVLVAEHLVRGRNWQEFSLSPAFGRHVFIAEGAAEAGAELVTHDIAGEAVTVERLVLALDQAIPDLVADYLDGTITRQAAVARLEDEALVPDAEAFLAFAERTRLRAVVYPIARRAVWAALHRPQQAGTHARFAWDRLMALFSTAPFALE